MSVEFYPSSEVVKSALYNPEVCSSCNLLKRLQSKGFPEYPDDFHLPGCGELKQYILQRTEDRQVEKTSTALREKGMLLLSLVQV